MRPHGEGSATQGLAVEELVAAQDGFEDDVIAAMAQVAAHDVEGRGVGWCVVEILHIDEGGGNIDVAGDEPCRSGAINIDTTPLATKTGDRPSARVRAEF